MSYDKEGFADAASATSSGKDGDPVLPSFGQVMEVQGDAHFHEVTTKAPLDPWSKTSLQLYAIFLVCALNATCSGESRARNMPTMLQEAPLRLSFELFEQGSMG